MSKFNDINDKVVFLEDSDFDSAGMFKHSQYGKPMVAMLSTSYCPHCIKAVPVLNSLAKNNKNIIVAVIKADGSAEEKKLAKRMGDLAKVAGVPSFLLFQNGYYKKLHSGARTEKALKEFANSTC